MSNTRPWLWGVTGAVVAIAVTIGAVQLLSDGEPAPADGTPTATADPTDATTEPVESPTGSPTESEAPATFTVATYFLGETGRGPRLFREFQRADGTDAGTAALQAALSGADDPDYRTPWAEHGVGILTVSGNEDLVTIDLDADASRIHDRPARMDEATADLALEQLMRTAQGALQVGRAPVRFLVQGEHTDSVFGRPTSEPLANADDLDVLAHIWIDNPAEGSTVRPGDTVEGLAAAFEANVLWRLEQDGTVVREGFTTAEECCRMAPYSFELPQVPAGSYTLVVSEDDPSGGEGTAPDQDTRAITVG